MQMCHSLRCKLLVENMESLGMSSCRPPKLKAAILVLVKYLKL